MKCEYCQEDIKDKKEIKRTMFETYHFLCWLKLLSDNNYKGGWGKSIL